MPQPHPRRRHDDVDWRAFVRRYELMLGYIAFVATLLLIVTLLEH